MSWSATSRYSVDFPGCLESERATQRYSKIFHFRIVVIGLLFLEQSFSERMLEPATEMRLGVIFTFKTQIEHAGVNLTFDILSSFELNFSLISFSCMANVREQLSPNCFTAIYLCSYI